MLGALVTLGNSDNDESSSSSRKAPDWRRRCCQRQPPAAVAWSVTEGLLRSHPTAQAPGCGRGLAAGPWSNLGGRPPRRPRAPPRPEPPGSGPGVRRPVVGGKRPGTKKNPGRFTGGRRTPTSRTPGGDAQPRRLRLRPRGRPRCVGPRRRPRDPRAVRPRAPASARARGRGEPSREVQEQGGQGLTRGTSFPPPPPAAAGTTFGDSFGGKSFEAPAGGLEELLAPPRPAFHRLEGARARLRPPLRAE